MTKFNVKTEEASPMRGETFFRNISTSPADLVEASLEKRHFNKMDFILRDASVDNSGDVISTNMSKQSHSTGYVC